jgi:hypothetical protein
VLGLVARVDPVDLMDRAVRVHLHLAVQVHLLLAALVHLHRAGLVARVDPVDLMDLAVPVHLHPVGLVVRRRMVRVDLADLTGPAVRDRTDLVSPVGLVGPDRMDLVGRAALGDRVDRVVPVGLITADLVVLGDRVGLVGLRLTTDHRRRRTCNAVSTTGVARSGVVHGTHRTGSARRITARHPRHRKMDSDGTVDLRQERRHPTGTGHRLPAAGTDRRPPVAGIPGGTGPDAT